MPAGDYYLNKFNGASIDEKIFTAVSGRVIGFDANLDPIMYDVSLNGHTHINYVPYTGANGNVDLGSNTLTTPIVIGGTRNISTLTLQHSSNTVFVATAPAINFNVGSNGGTNAMTIFAGGKIAIGSVTAPTDAKLYLAGGSFLMDNNQTFLAKDTTTGTVSPFHFNNANEMIFGYRTSGSGTYPLKFYTGSQQGMVLAANGTFGIGVTSPTAYLHLRAGALGVGRAPLKFTAGANLYTEEAGAMEFDGTNLYFTPGTVRQTISFVGHTHPDLVTNNGMSITNAIPKFDGWGLIDSRIFDDGDNLIMGLNNTIVTTNVGYTIMGSDNEIDGTSTVALNLVLIGSASVLHGTDSTLIGSGSWADGQFNYVIGNNVYVEGHNNIVIGQSSAINASSNTVIIGSNANVFGSSAVAIGTESYVAQNYGFAIGRAANSGGMGDFALGWGANVSTSTDPSMMINVGQYTSTSILSQGNTLAIMGGTGASTQFFVGIDTLTPTHTLQVLGIARASEFTVQEGIGEGGIASYSNLGASYLTLASTNESTTRQAVMIFEVLADNEQLNVVFQGPADQAYVFGSKYNRGTTPYYRTFIGDNWPVGAPKSILEFYASGNKCMSFDTTLSAPINLYYALNTNSQISSSLAQGSAPFAVVSTTLCTNLNADLLDGNHASAFSLSGHTHTYDNFVSWDISANSGTASQIYKSGSASSYKGVNFVGSGNVSVSTNSNANGFINVNIAGSASYTHPAYTVFNPTLSGALVLASLTTDAIGSVTAVTTRTLTLANLGYTGATNATYYTGHTIYLNGASLVTIGSGGYLNVVATNAAGDPVVTLTGNAANFRYDISVSGIPNCTLTGYLIGASGLVAATDSLKVAFSKLQTQMPKTVYTNISDVLLVGSTPNDFYSYTLPANTLSSDNQRLELLYSGISASNPNGKSIQFYFGGTSYITINNASSTSLNWFLNIIIIRVSSSSIRMHYNGSWTTFGSGIATGTGINFTATNVIKLVAQGAASNDITGKLTKISHFSS